MTVKIKKVKARMTKRKYIALKRDIADAVNKNNVEAVYGLPDYQIADTMIELFFEEMRRQKKLGELK